MINDFNLSRLKMHTTNYKKNFKSKGLKIIKKKQENDYQEFEKNNTFIPYLNERDNIGRLIKNTNASNENSISKYSKVNKKTNKNILQINFNEENDFNRTEKSKFVFEKQMNVVVRNREFIKLINSCKNKDLDKSRNSFFFKNQGRQIEIKNNNNKEEFPCLGTYFPKFNLILPNSRTHKIHSNDYKINYNDKKKYEFLNVNEAFKKNNQKKFYLPNYKKNIINKINDKNDNLNKFGFNESKIKIEPVSNLNLLPKTLPIDKIDDNMKKFEQIYYKRNLKYEKFKGIGNK